MQISIIIILSLILSAILYQLHFFLSLMAMVIVAFPIYEKIQQFIEIVDLEKWAVVKENIYIISNHPSNGDELHIEDDDLRACCFFVPHNQVHQTAIDIKNKLIKSNNKRYIGKGLEAHQKLKVHELIYRFGSNCNEDFYTDFSNRVIPFIKRDRKARHSSLSTTEDKEWYLRQMSTQNFNN